MEKAKEPEVKEKKQRQRSPNYPAIGLRDAIERVRKLYETDGKAGAPDKLAAVHIGFASAHGQAMTVLAALKKFGLVELSNGRLVPTQRAIEILNLPETDPRRLQALKDAALSPAIYSELVQQHMETGFPADDVMQSELVTYKGFNRTAVAGFVKDFKDTLDFAGLSDLSQLKSQTEEESNMVSMQPAEDTGPIGSKASLLQKPQQTQVLGKEISLPIGVTDEGQVIFAHVRFDAPLKKGMLTSLKQLLDALEKNIA
jgi:hypothetical protein